MFQSGRTDFTRGNVTAEFAAGGLPPPSHFAGRLAQLCRGKSAPLLRLAGGRYGLSVFGQREVREYLGSISTAAQQSSAVPALTALVGKISGDAEQKFLAEAVACLDVKANRAAVVMVWLLTVDHLQRYVLRNKLADFNAAWAQRGDCHGRAVADQDDFLELRDESAFIEILRSDTIITKDVRKILDEKLGFRNTCAHPNDIIVTESKVVAAIEDLVYNVIFKYPL